MTATKIAPRQKSHHIKMSREDKIYNIVGIILFTIITLLCVYPFYYLMICTISDQKLVDLNQIILLPKGINFENYVEIFKVQNLGNAAFISVARTGTQPCADQLHGLLLHQAEYVEAQVLVSLHRHYYVLLRRHDPHLPEQPDAGPCQ